MVGPRGIALLLASLALAGCAGGGDGEGATPEDLAVSDLGLEATATTGLIRGVVVDEAIRPLGNASITLLGGSQPREARSNAAGAFGFDGLPAGTYFLKVQRFGFTEVQQSAEVVAGVEEPPIVKVLLVRIPGLVAFVEAFVWEGFMECGTNNLIACAVPNFGSQITCSATSGNQPPVPPTTPVCLGNITNDEFTIFHAVTANATYLQSELVWESTQALGDRLSLLLRYGSRTDFDAGFYNGSLNSSQGSSPVMASVNQTDLDEAEVGTTNGLVIAIFPGRAEATMGTPVAFGAAAQQRWTTYTHAFHNYQPAPGWLFTSEGGVPPPPE